MANKIICIYKITSPTGRIYIGQTWDLSRRIITHKSHSKWKKNKLYTSINKYGWNKHSIEIIKEFTNPTQKDLDEQEVYYMSLYPKVLLNLREGGSRGKCSDETKRKMSKAQSNIDKTTRKHTDETKDRIREAMKGNSNGYATHTDETKEKLRQIALNRTPEQIQKAKDAQKLSYQLNPISQERKDKLRISALKRWENKRNKSNN